MRVDIKPLDIKVLTINLRKKGGNKCQCTATIPIDLIRKYDLKNNERIVIAYLCREEEEDKIGKPELNDSES